MNSVGKTVKQVTLTIRSALSSSMAMAPGGARWIYRTIRLEGLELDVGWVYRTIRLEGLELAGSTEP